MAKTKTPELTEEALAQLSAMAERRPRLQRRLHQYLRHAGRIRTLERVLDPKDAAAGFNPKTGSEDSLREELGRRQGEIKTAEKYLLRTLDNAQRGGD